MIEAALSQHGNIRFQTKLAWAWRDIRGSLAAFWVLLICLVLGIGALTGVRTLSDSIQQSLSREGATLVGGDINIRRVQQPFSQDILSKAQTEGTTSTTTQLRTMVRRGQEVSLLSEVKGVDKNYPLYGRVVLESGRSLQDVLQNAPAHPTAVAERSLLDRLGIKPGDQVEIGAIQVTIADVLLTEPDKLSLGLGFGPRLMLREETLNASGLVREGSLVTYNIRVKSERSVRDLEELKKQWNEHGRDEGLEVRTRESGSPQVSRQIERLTQLLEMVALVSLLVGGIGIANAVSTHVERRRNTIATMRCLGAQLKDIKHVFLLQITGLVLTGVLMGISLGITLAFAVTSAIAPLMPFPVKISLETQTLLLSSAFGILLAMGFALPPLRRLSETRALHLFRSRYEDKTKGWGMWDLRLWGGIALLAGALLAHFTAADRRLTLVFLGGSAAALWGLHLIADILMWACRKSPIITWPLLRMAVGNIGRPRAPTPSIVLSLGLGITLMGALTIVDQSLRHQLRSGLPQNAPSYFLVDVPEQEKDKLLENLSRMETNLTTEAVPMLRGRIVRVKGEPAENLKLEERFSWVLQGDRGVTHSAKLPKNSTLAEGTWWDENNHEPRLISLEKDIAHALGVSIGDTLHVNVLGRTLEAKVHNLRSLSWESLGINFVMVFSPKTFKGAPVTHLITLTLPNTSTHEESDIRRKEDEIARYLAKEHPNLAAIRVRDVLTTASSLLKDIMMAMQMASLLALATSLVVLVGALTTIQNERKREGALLQALGCTRHQRLSILLIEYGLITSATMGMATAAAFAISKTTLSKIIQIPLYIDATSFISLLATIITASIGIAVTFSLLQLRNKPAKYLRDM